MSGKEYKNMPNFSSKKWIWTGRLVFIFVTLFLLSDGVIHVLKLPVAVASFISLGYSPNVSIPLGIIELICLGLYCLPRTSVLGAMLLTGYLGGAVATNVRAELPLFTNILFPVYIGILLWGVLYIRDERLRTAFRWS